MKIVMTGSSGLIGTALVPELRANGHQVVRLVRRAPQNGEEIFWDPDREQLDSSALEGVEAVIHLAGKNVASGRWTAERKRQIRASRVQSTQFLSRTIAAAHRPPRLLLSASAIGIYGDRGDEILTEGSEAGRGFFAAVGRDWEAATEPAARAGVRVVHLRFGMVLSGRGGALQAMLPIFRLGLGGRLGSGQQFWSWIAMPDAVSAILHLIGHPDVAGPVNMVSPGPVRNREFTRALATALGRPAWFPVPVFALRLAVGEMADEALLASTRARPKQLERSGFEFRYPQLSQALSQALAGDGSQRNRI